MVSVYRGHDVSVSVDSSHDFFQTPQTTPQTTHNKLRQLVLRMFQLPVNVLQSDSSQLNQSDYQTSESYSSSVIPQRTTKTRENRGQR